MKQVSKNMIFGVMMLALSFGVYSENNVLSAGTATPGEAVLSGKQPIVGDEETNKVVPIGSILVFAGTAPPKGWLLCHGQEVNREKLHQLFAVIGTGYGAGNGTTTFNLPNLQQRFPLGKALSGTGTSLGESGGQIDHVHGIGDHQHKVISHSHSIGSHTHNFATGGGSKTWKFRSSSEGVSGNLNDHTHSGTTGAAVGGNTGEASPDTEPAGAGYTTSANPPYLVVNYIIKVK